ncbi:hypothetical protein EMPG_14417 [Blastomyces silverae]|uniref:Uncharacterized protein n=1 Tax=Blastomyces silverae TaxID=2060906 RepID=A0A0H1BFM8_9EURO|nr:hypothetical protein EMPG_14417 [Blastomyces silverae]
MASTRTHYSAGKEMSWNHQSHVILSQARMDEIMIDELQRLDMEDVQYNCEVGHVQVDSATTHDPDAYPVRALVTPENGAEEILYAKHALGEPFPVSSMLGLEASFLFPTISRRMEG